jgi:hypothetical protein
MEWILIEDKSPRRYQKVLFVTVQNNIYYGHLISNSKSFYSLDKDCTVYGVSHWMEIPEPPKK